MSDLKAEVTSAAELEIAVRLAGALDLSTAPMLGELIDAAVAVTKPTVVLYLSEVTYIDLHGLDALIAAQALARRSGARLLLRSPSRVVLDTLMLTGADALMTIELPEPFPTVIDT